MNETNLNEIVSCPYFDTSITWPTQYWEKTCYAIRQFTLLLTHGSPEALECHVFIKIWENVCQVYSKQACVPLLSQRVLAVDVWRCTTSIV